jgi:hypothetical protein
MNSKKENLLTSEELDCIIGGVMISDGGDEVNNVNSRVGCKCMFNNAPSVNNTNNAEKCRCFCDVYLGKSIELFTV